MNKLAVKLHLDTATANVRDIVCSGGCRHRSAVECAQTTYLVFPYRGVYVRHVGRNDSVAESNQVLFFNAGEEYRISHPVKGGDAASRSAWPSSGSTSLRRGSTCATAPD